MIEFLILLLLAFAACVFFAYKHNKRELARKELNVEESIIADKVYMAQNYGNDYLWYETSITLKNFLDEDGGDIESIENVFQVSIEEDPLVVIFTHTNNEDRIDKAHSFWVEDFKMDDVSVTYEQALELVNKVNLPKPHSRHCVLRKQVAPKVCNPQYIFGNQQSQIYVDAVTGDVSDKNPAFKE